MLENEHHNISLKELLEAEHSLRGDHPNPKREGCPEHSVLVRLANFTVGDPPFDHAILFHISECDPCFTELLRLRKARKKG